MTLSAELVKLTSETLTSTLRRTCGKEPVPRYSQGTVCKYVCRTGLRARPVAEAAAQHDAALNTARVFVHVVMGVRHQGVSLQTNL